MRQPEALASNASSICTKVLVNWAVKAFCHAGAWNECIQATAWMLQQTYDHFAQVQQ